MDEEPPSPYPCLLAQANDPRRLVHRHDDSDADSCACPYAALLGGIPDRISRDRLFSPLCGLMVSRYRRGDAFTSTPEGQEWHLHGEQVVEDRLIFAPSPSRSLRDGDFRETDRTSMPLLDAGLTREKHPRTPLGWALALRRPATLLVPAPARVRRLGQPHDSTVCAPGGWSGAGAGGTGGGAPGARAGG